MKQQLLLIVIGCTFLALGNRADAGNGFHLDDPYDALAVRAVRDTVPFEDRTGDFITDPNRNPFDLDDPSVIEQEVEYDPETGNYIVQERIGDFFFRTPTELTTEEYLDYRRQQEQDDYFKQLAGISTGDGESANLDPIAQFDVQKNLIDRIFGGNSIEIDPQGGVDLTLGVDFQRLDNPILTERQRTQGGFDFDMNIQMNVTGKIGEKLTLSTNYNTNATFDFDNQIKLDYNSDLFSEDEILKTIEAGNVSLPLRGTLIQGAQSLFGVKTALQFGHLRLTTIISQQNSERENIQIQGGSQLQEFEVRADEYDENRHFFLTHYNRNTFEESLRNLPQIQSLFHIENIEVWITNNRNEVDEVRDIVAFADLGETSDLVSPDAVNAPMNPAFPDIFGSRGLPDNEANDLYQRLIANPNIRQIDQAVSILQSSEFNLQQTTDFEKVSARKLRPTEYNFNPDLGYISLNINVQPNQVVGVAFQYSYNGKNYKVGELSNNSEQTRPDSSLNVLFVKMLKSTTQRTDVPTWDLMMKNIYAIGAFQASREDFDLDIYYEDPGEGFKRFLPTSNLAGEPLLRVFNLDNLNVQGDPQPDGVFDFVPGLTINTNNGRVMFPVLEPFGSSLANQLEGQEFIDQYVYQQLYDSTLFLAQEFPEKNRFVIRGSYKSSVSSEISLGSFNIPPGSVRVTAGGQVLREGIDYEIDYNIGRVRILNDAILNSGVPVNVSFEDNAIFGFQRKTMLGLRADYELDENFIIGGTFMKLFERPFTQKVNIGDDPINNNIYGLDLNFTRPAPWLTRAVDNIPGISTKAPSSISVSAEGAVIQPGHSRAINQSRRDDGGIVYIDDFEGTASSFDIRQPTINWVLASVPQNDQNNNNPLFPESALVNDRRYGANRAKLNWYRIDDSARRGNDNQDPYTSIVPQTEVFPNANIPPDQLPNIQTLDLTYYPGRRGPYNFDVPGGFPGFTSGVSFLGDSLILRDPQTRWGGVMRALNTNDFQAANIEFLEFWVLSPFLDPENPSQPVENWEEKQGDFYINLGNISEDILRDSRKFFENGLPSPFNPDRQVDTTNWSVIPIAQQITNAFDVDPETREVQDVGLDGLTNEAEQNVYRDYIDQISMANDQAAARIFEDPADDDFRYYNDNNFYTDNDGILRRYSAFNNPHGNSGVSTGAFNQAATNIPDAEDLDRDNTLNETESYFQYRIPIRANPANPREIDQNVTPFITDRVVSNNGERIWYRFRVPLTSNNPNRTVVGGIRDFRSIRFMRMYLTGFEDQVTLRFARLELVRNQWRRYSQDLSPESDCSELDESFDVDVVNIEENSDRQPFNYVLPEGIVREQQVNSVFSGLQNEQSLSIITNGLCDGEEQAVFKNVNLDMRVYKRLRMFVHAEELEGFEIEPGAQTIFIRVGSDFRNNYYEYEIPLFMSDVDNLPVGDNVNNLSEYKQEVWRIENEFNILLEDLIDTKLERNRVGFSLEEEYVKQIESALSPLPANIKVRGNPNLGLAKVIMVGVRNPEGGNLLPQGSEVWINEMQLTGLDERGGAAAIARVDLQMADLGNLTLSGNFSSIGFGAIDQKVQERSREQVLGYDVATNLELGRFFPQQWGLSIPFYAQHSNTTRTPEFDPYDLDVTLEKKLDNTETPEVRDSLREQAQDITTISTFNFTNVRKQRTNNTKKPKPWDIENFGFNYSQTTTNRSDPIIERDRREEKRGGFDYNYSVPVNYVEPFEGIKAKPLRIIKEINFNPIPNNFSFSTILSRRFASTKYRFTGLADRFSTFYNKSFTWDRNYNLQWDLTKSLKFNFTATNLAVVDEPDELALIEDPTVEDVEKARRDSIWQNLKRFGRPKNYRHSFNVSYTLPIRYLPGLDWIQMRAQYQAEYGWTAAALNADSLGNVIQNGQNRQFSADFNFEQLYNKSKYLASINRGSRTGNRGGGRSPRGLQRQQDPTRKRQGADQNADQEGQEDNKRSGPSVVERILIRPLLLLRSARFNYNEEFRTVVPGFTPQSNILGLSPGFEAPGWDFVAGGQPLIRELNQDEYFTDRDWLAQAVERGWITNNVFLNQEVVQNYTQNYDVRITLEPFRDFRIDLQANRTFTENHTQFFKDTLFNDVNDFVHAIPKDVGSLDLSYLALNNLFNDSNEEIKTLFDQFEANRVIISQRLGEGEHADTILAQQGYTFGYGRTQQEVLTPAFIAAYTGEDPNAVGLDIFNELPNINWQLTYNGLSRIPLFADLFQNFSLTHGYRSNLTVNRFNTGLDFLRTNDRPGGPVNELNQNFYPRLEIPEVAIQESFAPLVGIDATLNNGMSFNANYAKSRRLAMSFVSNQLAETRTTEFVIGFGWLLRDVNIGFLTGDQGGARKDGDAPRRSAPSGRVRQLQGRDLDISFNFSLRDDVTFNHLLDQDVIEPTRGNRALTISPAAEYRLNQRLSLRLFVDYRRNVPRTSAGFPRTDTSGGVVVRFSL